MDEVAIEKRIEFQNRSGLVFTFEYKDENLFSSVRPGQLKRILSNLINNAAEAIAGDGEIKVKVSRVDQKNVIEVSDSGKGISKEVLGKVFVKGFTTKEKGNGIGLFSAKDGIQAMGGAIDFESTEGHGTTFRLSFDAVESTKSLIKRIDVDRYQKIIILDDDLGFHEVWKTKFIHSKIKLIHFYSIGELLKNYQKLEPSVLLLSDLELLGEEMDGIDLILHLDHAKHSILISGKADDVQVKKRCQENDVKLISKSVISQIQVFETTPFIVLIDDEELIHISWRIYFKNKPVQFVSFNSVDEFLQNASSFDLNTSSIYIDSHLGELRGEVESEKISSLGFKNLYLETGYSKEAIEKPHWILEIYPKTPGEIFE